MITTDNKHNNKKKNHFITSIDRMFSAAQLPSPDSFLLETDCATYVNFIGKNEVKDYTEKVIFVLMNGKTTKITGTDLVLELYTAYETDVSGRISGLETY